MSKLKELHMKDFLKKKRERERERREKMKGRGLNHGQVTKKSSYLPLRQ